MNEKISKLIQSNKGKSKIGDFLELALKEENLLVNNIKLNIIYYINYIVSTIKNL